MFEDAFHSTKYSGLKFWVFYTTNGTVFSGSLDYPIPGHQVPSFAQKYEIKWMALLPYSCRGVLLTFTIDFLKPIQTSYFVEQSLVF